MNAFEDVVYINPFRSCSLSGCFHVSAKLKQATILRLLKFVSKKTFQTFDKSYSTNNFA